MTEQKAPRPYPYDQDLSTVITHTNRLRQSSRDKLANDLATISYIHAGWTLLMQELEAAAPLPPDQDTLPEFWSGFRFPSQRAVIAQMNHNPAPFLQRGGVGHFRSIWKRQQHFVLDLLNFTFWSMNYEPQSQSEPERVGASLAEDSDFVVALETVAHHELKAILAAPLFRLQLIMAATANHNDRVRDAIADSYRGALDPWVRVYKRAFDARHIRLRPGVSFDDLTIGLTALTEGLALRSLGDAGATVFDSEHDRSQLGKLAMIFLVGALVSTRETVSLRIEEVLRQITSP